MPRYCQCSAEVRATSRAVHNTERGKRKGRRDREMLITGARRRRKRKIRYEFSSSLKELAKSAPVYQIMSLVSHKVPKAKAPLKVLAKSAPVCQMMSLVSHTVPKARTPLEEVFPKRRHCFRQNSLIDYGRPSEPPNKVNQVATITGRSLDECETFPSQGGGRGFVCTLCLAGEESESSACHSQTDAGGGESIHDGIL